MNRLLAVVLLLQFQSNISFAKDNADQRGADLLAKAGSLQNIHEHGSQPFQLRLRIHTEHITSKPIDGSFAEVWMTPDKWRREIAFPGFTQLEVGDVGSTWLSRNMDFRPRPVSLTAIAIDAFTQPSRSVDEVVKSVRNRKVAGSEAQCIEVVGKSEKRVRELCFDSSGLLIRESFGTQRFEYSSFSKFGTKSFPKSIRIYESDRRILDIQTDELTSPGDPRPELFEHQGSSRRMAGCEIWPAEAIKKIAPQYPSQARAEHQQGTVALYALLSEQGTVEKSKVVQSAGDSLDRSAMDAVKQWQYPPPACGGPPLPTEIEVQINYELRSE